MSVLQDGLETKRGKPPKGPPYSVYGFPQIVATYAMTRTRAVDIYTRSLLLEGNGYPVFYPYGRYQPDEPSRYKPVTIGDVGVVETDGHFHWLFNMFLPADRPTQLRLPHEFQPFTPAPADSDIVFTPGYHKPGTIITSPGVNVDIQSKEPWHVNFTSDETQAGMLILQGGADRYDLNSSERYHEYIAKNAQIWYQVANNFTEVTYPNGSLLVVTGYDSCDRFSHTQFAPETNHLRMNMTFMQELGDTPGEWPRRGNNATVGWPFRPESGVRVVDGPLTVFVRGIRISVQGRIWRSILPSLGFLPKNTHFALVASKPTKGQLLLDKAKIKLGFGLTELDLVEDYLSLRESTFQPNYILGQILLGQFPEASVALVEDETWCSFVEKGRLCTLPEINKLIGRVLDGCDIVEYHGTLKLIARSKGIPRQLLDGERLLVSPPSWARHRPDHDWVRHNTLAKFP